MSDQDILDAHSYGFDDGCIGCDKDNPYFSYYQGEFDLWKAYEKGYREGVAEKKRLGNAEAEQCPKCGGTVGHRINCPDGIAFSHPKEQDR